MTLSLTLVATGIVFGGDIISWVVLSAAEWRRQICQWWQCFCIWGCIILLSGFGGGSGSELASDAVGTSIGFRDVVNLTYTSGSISYVILLSSVIGIIAFVRGSAGSAALYSLVAEWKVSDRAA